MKENLLHYVWKTKSFPFLNLTTTEDISISIDHFGYYNLNSGPDFLEGGISLENTKWKGHIEMHVFASDWIKHNHQLDPAYDCVILHVVWEEDEIIYRSDGSRIPCIEMKSLIPPSLVEGYERLMNHETKLPCSHFLKTNDQSIFHLNLHRMCIERLEAKCYPISMALEEGNKDWSQLLFSMIAHAMGLRVNASAMETLARSIPVHLLSKHRYNPFQCEALLFGQAGMLSSNWQDQYPRRMHLEYQFLKDKYLLQPMAGKEWKLMRMRPSSFPTIRIAQLAQLYISDGDLHSKIMKATSVQELKRLFQINASEYWDTHYLFDKESQENSIKKIGDSSINSILINGIIPFYFAYGQHRSEDHYMEKAIQFLQDIPAENNKIIRSWKSHNIHIKTSYESQGLIQLTKEYCSKKRCLECAFGNKVIKQISTMVKEEQMHYNLLPI